MFRYVPFESKEIPGTTGVHTLYGIRVLNAQGHEIASVSDVSADRLLIDNLCGLCTNRQLSPIHLVDVIEDFTLAETLKNFVAVMPQAWYNNSLCHGGSQYESPGLYFSYCL